jgi:hypothetical protein
VTKTTCDRCGKDSGLDYYQFNIMEGANSTAYFYIDLCDDCLAIFLEYLEKFKLINLIQVTQSDK